jgi:glycosyltransferase involved in cell wall biosynthesis
MCKITIFTVTYNREHLLPRAINSVLAQTFSDFEYLIINNGSTDGTQALIEKYCKEDTRIHAVSYSKNEVTANAFQEKYQLIRELPAPFFTKIDDDDYMKPNTLETLYNLITEHKADGACVGSMYEFPDGTKKNKFVFDGTYVYNRVEAMVEMLKREKFNAALGGKLFRKEVLDIVYPNVEQIRDIHISYRRMNHVNRMVVNGDPLFYFYRHDSNVSGLNTPEQITPQKMRQHLEANAMRTEWLAENMPEIKDFVFYCELSFMISLYERIYRLDVQTCFDIALEMKETLIRHSAFLSECNFCTEREKEILRSM